MTTTSDRPVPSNLEILEFADWKPGSNPVIRKFVPLENYERARAALQKLDNGDKYPTEVITIAREGLSGDSPCPHLAQHGVQAWKCDTCGALTGEKSPDETTKHCPMYWNVHAARCLREAGHEGECWFAAPSSALPTDKAFGAMPSAEETGRELTLKDFGYAPGNYTCKCLDCDQEFVGDKRASRCEACAAQALRENRSGAQKAKAHPVEVCAKLDHRGLHCQNPPGHEGDCDGLPF